MSSAYISQLIRQAATRREDPYIVDASTVIMVDTSAGQVTVNLPRVGTPGAHFEIRPGHIVNSLWWPEVIVSRIVPGPPRPVIPPATGPVERRQRVRWELPRTEPEVSGQEYARAPFMVREEPGIAVANVAGIRRLEVNTGELEAERQAQINYARQSIMAEEDRRILEALEQLGQEAPVESVQFNRDEPFSMSFWARRDASGEYGWHAEPTRHLPRQPPPHGPTYLEPSHVYNPAVPTARVPAERVQMPEFEIASNPTIRLSEVRERRFNLVDRIRDGSVSEVSMGSQVPYEPNHDKTYTNEPRPYCPSVWERLLGDDFLGGGASGFLAIGPMATSAGTNGPTPSSK